MKTNNTVRNMLLAGGAIGLTALVVSNRKNINMHKVNQVKQKVMNNAAKATGNVGEAMLNVSHKIDHLS